MTDGSNHKAATAESFNGSADGYRTSRTHRQGADLERLASWCAGATRALDVATGAGHTAGALVEAGIPDVVASDASPSMVASSGRSFPSIDGVVADAERLPFAANTFDAATCRIAAHHLPDPEAFVAEVGRVVRPGGVFAFEDNVAPEDDALAAFLERLETMRDPTHVESYPTATWRRWLIDAGFAVEEVDHVLKPIYVEPWIDRMADLGPEETERIRRLLLDAPAEVAAAFDIRTAGGAVRSFGSRKALIRAVRLD